MIPLLTHGYGSFDGTTQMPRPQLATPLSTSRPSTTAFGQFLIRSLFSNNSPVFGMAPITGSEASKPHPPKIGSSYPLVATPEQPGNNIHIYNIATKKELQRREHGLATLSKEVDNLADKSSTLPLPNQIHRLMFDFLPGTRYSPTTEAFTSTLVPLYECILAILWEFRETSSSLSILRDRTVDEFAALIQGAAIFQARTESVSDLMTSLIIIILRLTQICRIDLLHNHSSASVAALRLCMSRGRLHFKMPRIKLVRT